MTHPSRDPARQVLAHAARHRPDHEPDTDADAARALSARLGELRVPQPHAVAAELVASLRARGWRPTGITGDWQRAPAEPADPDRVHGYAELARAALAGRVASLEAERLRPVPPAPGGGGEP